MDPLVIDAVSLMVGQSPPRLWDVTGQLREDIFGDVVLTCYTFIPHFFYFYSIFFQQLMIYPIEWSSTPPPLVLLLIHMILMLMFVFLTCARLYVYNLMWTIERKNHCNTLAFTLHPSRMHVQWAFGSPFQTRARGVYYSYLIADRYRQRRRNKRSLYDNLLR